MNSIWLQMCEAAGFDPQVRMAAREAVLGDPAALDCTLYRADEEDPDAEEQDLGDARILFSGGFVPPQDWSAEDREAFYDGEDPAAFLSARIECEAAADSRDWFVAEPGDYVAVMRDGVVEMYFICDCDEDEAGVHCVLVQDDVELD